MTKLRSLCGAATAAPDATARISVDTLRDLVFYGITETKHRKRLRPICWRVLLGVLDEEPAQWRQRVNDQRVRYRNLKRQMIGSHHESKQSNADPEQYDQKQQDIIFEQDCRLMKEIQKVYCGTTT